VPVAIANTTSGNWNSAASTQTLSVTRAAGEGLLFGFYYEYDFGTPDAVSSVVWDSAGDNQSMTLLETQQSGATVRWLSAWYLAAPTSAKTANITVTFAGSQNNRGMMICRHITGHDTASMIRASAKLGGDETSPFGVAVSSDTGDLVLDFMLLRDFATQVAPVAPQSDAVEYEHPSAARTLSSSTNAGASPTVTNSYTTGAIYDTAIINISIQPAPTVISALNLYQRFNVNLRL
jgi:hypothetical protein